MVSGYSQVSNEHKVVNLDTEDWTPGQVSRWLQQQVDDGEIISVHVVIERKDEEGPYFLNTWSVCTRQALLYMMTWTYQGLLHRHFGRYLD